MWCWKSGMSVGPQKILDEATCFVLAVFRAVRGT